MCAADHVVRFTRPSPSVLQAIKNWSRGRPGNEAKLASLKLEREQMHVQASGMRNMHRNVKRARVRA